MQHARPTRFGRAVLYTALLALLGVVSITLSQCTLVGDNLTGVGLNSSRPTTCIKQCNDLYKMLYDQEQKKHLEEVAKCQDLDQPYKDQCMAAETARHEAEKMRLSQAKIECQNGCHRQGGGSAN